MLVLYTLLVDVANAADDDDENDNDDDERFVCGCEPGLICAERAQTMVRKSRDATHDTGCKRSDILIHIGVFSSQNIESLPYSGNHRCRSVRSIHIFMTALSFARICVKHTRVHPSHLCSLLFGMQSHTHKGTSTWCYIVNMWYACRSATSDAILAGSRHRSRTPIVRARNEVEQIRIRMAKGHE